jgi:hypothetical protein
MSTQRSSAPEVRNPLLALPAMEALLALPLEQRGPLASLLEELSTQAHEHAERSWRQRKGPMAAYWRAVGVYARHTARALATAAERRQAARQAEAPAAEPRPPEPWWVGRRDRDQLTGAYSPESERRDPLTGEVHW